MTRLIEALLNDYERGTVSRRELVKALALGIVPAGLTSRRGAFRQRRESPRQDGVLRGININHVNLQNSDLDRSVDFYRELFSLPPKREVPGSPYALDLADGLSFLSVPQREPSGAHRSLLRGRGGFRAQSGSDRNQPPFRRPVWTVI